MANNQEIVKQVEQEVSPVLSQASEYKVSDNDTYVKAGEMLNDVKKAAKTIKIRKEQITKPLNEALKSARDLFKPLETNLADAERALKGTMLVFKREQDAIAEKKAAQIQGRVERGTMRPDTAVRKLGEMDTPDNTAAGVKESKVRVVEVVDWSKIPASYFERESVRAALLVEIRKDALGNKAQGIEPVEVPGVIVREEKNLSV